MAKLEADDAKRQNADFTPSRLAGQGVAPERTPESFVYDRGGKMVAQSIDGHQNSVSGNARAGGSAVEEFMRYLVRARVKPGRESDLLEAIEQQTLGRGSVAEGEYLRNMQDARLCADDTARWVEVCYCVTPLQEEQPYWEQYFDLTRVQDAHDRRKCRDVNGTEPWACGDCDCTARLEQKLKDSGGPFLDKLRSRACSGKLRQP